MGDTLTEDEETHLVELMKLSACPLLNTKFNILKPSFESLQGTACSECHHFKGRTKHTCNPDLVADQHSWEECVMFRHSFVNGHSEEKLRREESLLEWKHSKETWEINQRENHAQDRRLWKIGKEREALRTKETKRAKKRKLQFATPSKFSSFAAVQDLDGQ